MPAWPDKEEAHLNEFLRGLDYPPESVWGYRSMLRHFQRFATKREQALGQETLRSWLRVGAAEASLTYVIDRALFVKRFLDWLVQRGIIAENPFTRLRERYNCRSMSAIVRALLDAQPKRALEALRPPSRYASHLGPLICEHVERMRALGFRYRNEDWFIRFDRYLQQRSGAENEPFATLAREYVATAASAVGRLHHLSVTRVVAGALQRAGVAVIKPAADRLLLQEVARKRPRPYIYSVDEISRLLEIARSYDSTKYPLRAMALHCMIALAYCAGLRIGELLGLEIRDVNVEEATIEIRDSKFFKSRCLPLSLSASEVVRNYLAARAKAKMPGHPEAPFFCHAHGGYGRARASELLRTIIRLAGLKPNSGRGGPRIHDLRHSFVVHRMTQWYEQGINPQGRLAHLAAYLGHRDINSTLVYLTITQELLQPQHLHLKSPAHVRLMGKGQKERIAPLWPETAELLTALLRRKPRLPEEPLFVNRYGNPLTASGFRFRLRKYVKSASLKVQSLSRKRVTPHLFRHTTAVHLVSAGVDVTVIRSWLGHASLETTNHYAQANLETKRSALEKADPKLRPGKPPRWKRDTDLLAWLHSL
jgi:site-specific recombinase XerD